MRIPLTTHRPAPAMDIVDRARRLARMGAQWEPRRPRTMCALLVASLVIGAQFAECQFFTKSSKSIPRMGRRSPLDSSPEAKTNLYRRMLIDRLVDEFGASLFTNLLNNKTPPQATEDPALATSKGELYQRNEQPFDARLLPAATGDAEDPRLASLTRNERSDAGAGGGAGPNGNALDEFASTVTISRPNYHKQSSKSLAMRAFNADRLLQHLAAGGDPIMPYDRYIASTRDRASYNSGD